MNTQRCRICLKNGNNMISFFSSTMIQNQETGINEMYSGLLSNSQLVESPGNSPQFICEQCVLSLKQAYVFKILCHLSQEYRQKYSKQLGYKSNNCFSSKTDYKRSSNILKRSRSSSGTKMRLRSNGDLCTISDQASPKQTSLNLPKSSNLDCDICDRSFRNLSTLTKHLNYLHQLSYMPNKCTKNSAAPGILDAPKHVHAGVKYICSTCKKGFTSASLLNLHSRSHVTKRNYKCSTCGKSFLKPMHLAVHMRTHSVGKPHLCYMCKTHHSQDDLRGRKCVLRHEQKHICTICKKRFVSNKTLSVHMQKHIGSILLG